MNSVTYNISLDVHKTATQVFLYAIRGDTSRVIAASLTENGKPYEIADGCSAYFFAEKPDGCYINGAKCNVDTSKNIIIYNTWEINDQGKKVSQVTAAVGEVKCQIMLIGNDNRVLCSPTFSIIISDTVCDDNNEEIESSSEYMALLSALKDAENAVDNAGAAAQKADSAAEMAEEAAREAREAADSLEVYVVSAITNSEIDTIIK